VCKARLERNLKRPFIGRSDSYRDNRPVHRPSTTVLLRFAVVLTLAMGAPLARADRDHDRARAAVQAGQVLPLKTVLERLERDHPGQVLEVELERDQGRWVYEIKLLQAGGRLVKLEVDAVDGRVLRRKERSRAADARPSDARP
jgi:hypothetical protein